MSIVSVTKLSKKYGDFKAVKNISFDIRQGEIFGFLGPNGAGKTSTINMLIGLSRPSSGSITIDGIDGIREIKKVQKTMGIVPDESSFPMLFLCGLFLPVSSLPVFLQPLSYCLPLTYGANMLHITFNQAESLNIMLDLAALIGFSILLYFLCLRNIRQKWIL